MQIIGAALWNIEIRLLAVHNIAIVPGKTGNDNSDRSNPNIGLFIS
jgi:hypothetical protein